MRSLIPGLFAIRAGIWNAPPFSPAMLPTGGNQAALFKLDEGSGQVAKNYLAPFTTTSLNFATEQNLGDFGWWNGNTPTWTDNYAAGGANPVDNANLTVSRLQLGAGSFGGQLTCTLPGSTAYTFRGWFKSTDGVSSQILRLFRTGAFLTLGTANGGWQQFVVNFTTPGGGVTALGVFNDGTNAVDVLVYGLELILGTVGTGTYVQNRMHAFLTFRGTPTWTAKGLNTAVKTAGVPAVLSTPIASVSQISLYAAFRQASAGGTATPNDIITHLSANTLGFYLAASGNGGNFRFQGFSTSYGQTLVNLADDADHMLAATLDGSGVICIYLDNYLCRVISDAATPLTFRGCNLGGIIGVGGGIQGDTYLAGVFPVGHSTTNAMQAGRWIQAEANKRSGVSMKTYTKLLCYEGDSFTAGGAFGGVIGWPTKVHTDLSAGWAGAVIDTNLALSGSSIPNGSISTSLTARGPYVDTQLANGPSRSVLVVFPGRNDLNGVDGATYFNNLVTYCQARKAAGWQRIIVVVPPPTVTGNATYETRRQDAITRINADFAGANTLQAFSVIDFSANANIGTAASVGAAGGGTYWNSTGSDSIPHWTQAGEDYFATTYGEAAVTAALASISLTDMGGGVITDKDGATILVS